jgi:hypothetical protein
MSRQSSNHTPINFDNLLSRYQQKVATIGKNVGGSKMSSNIPNILLVIGVVAFVGAFTFSINQTQTSTNTRADAANGQSRPDEFYIANATSPFRTTTQYPKSYNGKTIPSSVYSEGESKYSFVSNKQKQKTYIIDRVGKYYMYTDLLTEKGIQVEAVPSNVTFDLIEKKVPELEKKVRTELVDNVDFTFIKAWTTTDQNDFKTQLRAKYGGDDLTSAADEKLTMYKERLQNGEPIETVLLASNVDQELLMLNNNEENLKITNYVRDDNFVKDMQNMRVNDPGFNTFIFGQNANEVSEIYDIGDDTKKIRKILIYATLVEKNEYPSLLEIYQRKNNLFSF